MNDVVRARAENMAFTAQREANEARHVAEKAQIQQSAHEVLCTERYNNINIQLASIPKIYDNINDLRAIANKAIGVWLCLVGVAIIIGAIYTITKFAHGS